MTPNSDKSEAKKTITLYGVFESWPKKTIICYGVCELWPKKTITFYGVCESWPKKTITLYCVFESWPKKTMTFYGVFESGAKKTITFYGVLSCGPSVAQENHYFLYEKIILNENTVCFMWFVSKNWVSYGFGSWVSIYRARNIIENPLLRCWGNHDNAKLKNMEKLFDEAKNKTQEPQ